MGTDTGAYMDEPELEALGPGTNPRNSLLEACGHFYVR